MVLSVGGELGTVSVGDATSASAFATSVRSIMTRFGFDGVDIDLENGVNPTFMGQALHQLGAAGGTGLILTLAPQTIDMQSTGGAYFQLALAVRDILTTVHTQYYNSGTMLGCDGKVYAQGTVDFLTALACIQLQGGLRPDQVALGLPASARAAGGGAVAPSVVNSALTCLAQGVGCGTFHPPTTWPGIRGRDDLVGQLGPGAGVRVREHGRAGAGPAAVAAQGWGGQGRPTPRPGRPCSPRRAAWTRSPAARPGRAAQTVSSTIPLRWYGCRTIRPRRPGPAVPDRDDVAELLVLPAKACRP